jgi:glycosyltransferase involved in cell wall biosynthesis
MMAISEMRAHEEKMSNVEFSIPVAKGRHSMQAIDVVILTRNSECVLNECLRSIYENVPVNRLIIVDRFSADETLKIIERYDKEYGNVVVLLREGTRAMARQEGIEKVVTEWFMFVDSDVVLCKDWFKKAWKLVDEEVGAIWGVDVPGNIKSSFLLKLLTQVSMRSFKARGGTHDILVRHKVVKGIEIPGNLHVYEDSFIKKWVLEKGHKVVATYDPYCIHFKPVEDWALRNSVYSAALEIKHGFMRYPRLYHLYSVVNWPIAFLFSFPFNSQSEQKTRNKQLCV